MKSIFTRDSQPGLRLLFLVVLSIALMIVDTRVAAVQYTRQFLSTVVLPLQYAVSGPLQFLERLQLMLSTQKNLLKENGALKTEQLLLKTQVQRLLSVEAENNQLKALLRSSAQVQGKVLIAQLLSVDIDPFVHQVILDKGAREGVFVGQPVLDANGVMGKVIQVGPYTSRVLLINDPHSGVPVQIARNGMRAIAMGDSFTGKLRLVNIPQTANVKTGDILVTSGLGEDYPEGYLLGEVASVTQDPGLQFLNIVVNPSAHLDRARQVLLVWPNKMHARKKSMNQNEMRVAHG